MKDKLTVRDWIMAGVGFVVSLLISIYVLFPIVKIIAGELVAWIVSIIIVVLSTGIGISISKIVNKAVK